MEQTVIPDPSPHSVAPHSEADASRRRRMLFRATHRGTHETDILIGGFVQHRLAEFSAEDLDALEEIMELPDVDLADWLTGRRPIPPEADTPMLRRIEQASHETARNARLGLVTR